MAIRQYWLQEIGAVETTTPALSVDAFLKSSEFEECYWRVMSLYPGVPNPPMMSAKSQLFDIPKNDTDMDYFKLRTFAKFTNLRPAGMFLLFTQLVGEELRAVEQGRDPKQACTQLLDGVQRIIEKTKQYMNDPIRDPKQRAFWRQYGEIETDNNILPNMELLKLWRDAFNQGELPKDPTSDEEIEKRMGRKSRRNQGS